MKWQPIESLKAEEGMKIIGCTTPKITKAGHEVGCYDVQIIRAHEDKWNGLVWGKLDGNLYFPTHWMPLPPPPANHQPRE